MRLRRYLNESIEKIISIKDSPDWVKSILKDKKMRKDITLKISPKANVGSNWSDFNIMTVYLYYKGKVEKQTVIGGVSMFDNKKESKVKKGFETELNIDKMILVVNTKPKMATLYVHPDSMVKMLNEPMKNDLSKEEIFTLVLLRSLKPSYRRTEASDYGIDFDSMISILKNKGYVSKNNSINKKGKNFLLSYFDHHMDVMNSADKLNIKRKY